MLVQVERTGEDQRESGHIHAEDVKDLLLMTGFDEAEIAIKTAEKTILINLRTKTFYRRLTAFGR